MNRLPRLSNVRWWGYLLLFCSLVLVGGCKSRGKVTGKVTFKNAPVTGGSVIFLREGGGPGGGGAEIDPKDGTYAYLDIPTGKYKVGVKPVGGGTGGPMGGGMMGPPRGAKGPPKDSGPPGGGYSMDPRASGAKPVPIPQKYQDPESSGLTVEVKKGENKFDIDIPAS